MLKIYTCFKTSKHPHKIRPGTDICWIYFQDYDNNDNSVTNLKYLK